MTVEELKNDPRYEVHHTSYIRQYVSRKTDGLVEAYEGRFGKGYKLLEPNWNSSIYSYCTYYTEA